MKLILCIALLFFSLTGWAEQINFKASAPNIVENGEEFRLSYTVKGSQDVSQLELPEINDFRILAGPSQSSSTSINYINGKMTKDITLTYTYVLMAEKEGTFTIAPAKIEIEGDEYHSNTISIQVLKASANRSQGSQSQHSQSNAVASNEKVNNDNLFVTVTVNKTSLYLGESLEATIKVYSNVNLINIGSTKFPSFNGFLAEDIPNNSRIELQRESYNGKIYNVGTIRKIWLFPQHTGEIEIEPFELDCIVRQQARSSHSFFDDFFDNYQDISIKRRSKPITINVKPLPSEGKPINFSGTVGNIALQTSLSNDTVNANDAVTYTVTYSGSGNLKLIEKPSINFPSDIENYDPKVTRNVKTGDSGMSGNVTFEYLLIPRFAGEYTIPAVEFSYFDSNSSSYKTLKSKEYHLFVNKGSQSASAPTSANIQSFKREDVKVLGEDIHYIRTGDLQLHPKGDLFYSTWAHWLGYIIPLVLFIGGILLNRQRIKANADIVRVKNKTANKMASKRMKAAASAMKNHNNELFYQEVLKALWGYVSYKLNIDPAELTRDNISDILQQKSVNVKLINGFITVLDDCEFARYAPGNPDQTMDKIYKNGIEIITKLDKAIK